jgi:hypothetical protein
VCVCVRVSLDTAETWEVALNDARATSCPSLHSRSEQPRFFLNIKTRFRMRWFRAHTEAPRLLSLSPLRIDEDENQEVASPRLLALSKLRGKTMRVY